MASLIQQHVEQAGLNAVSVRSGKAALEAIERDEPDLVVLDIVLPDVDGLEVCRRVRRRPETGRMPIVMLSADGDDVDVVAGIESGADDFITRPFNPKVLVARIRNLLRRRNQGMEHAGEATRRISLAEGTLVIDLDRHEILAGGENVDLTPTEFGILRYLASRPGFVRARDQIIASVRGDRAVLSPRAVDVHITALRRKLGSLGPLVETVRGVGYRIREQPDSVAS